MIGVATRRQPWRSSWTPTWTPSPPHSTSVPMTYSKPFRNGRHGGRQSGYSRGSPTPSWSPRPSTPASCTTGATTPTPSTRRTGGSSARSASTTTSTRSPGATSRAAAMDEVSTSPPAGIPKAASLASWSPRRGGERGLPGRARARPSTPGGPREPASAALAQPAGPRQCAFIRLPTRAHRAGDVDSPLAKPGRPIIRARHYLLAGTCHALGGTPDRRGGRGGSADRMEGHRHQPGWRVHVRGTHPQATPVPGRSRTRRSRTRMCGQAHAVRRPRADQPSHPHRARQPPRARHGAALPRPRRARATPRTGRGRYGAGRSAGWWGWPTRDVGRPPARPCSSCSPRPSSCSVS